MNAQHYSMILVLCASPPLLSPPKYVTLSPIVDLSVRTDLAFVKSIRNSITVYVFEKRFSVKMYFYWIRTNALCVFNPSVVLSAYAKSKKTKIRTVHLAVLIIETRALEKTGAKPCVGPWSQRVFVVIVIILFFYRPDTRFLVPCARQTLATRVFFSSSLAR